MWRRSLPDGTALLLGGSSARRVADAAGHEGAAIVDDLPRFREELGRLRGAAS